MADNTAPTSLIDVREPHEEPHAVVHAGTSANLIRITSRLGVWGLVGGYLPFIGLAFGLPIPLGLAATATGVGFLLSGIGTTAASWLVRREMRNRRGALKHAATAGLPLGVAMGFYGTSLLWRTPLLVRSSGLVLPVALLFGILVVIYLVVGFFLQWRSEDEMSGERPPARFR